jgi:hypothetical protein
MYCKPDPEAWTEMGHVVIVASYAWLPFTIFFQTDDMQLSVQLNYCNFDNQT